VAEKQYRPSRFIDAAKRGDDAAVLDALQDKSKGIDVNKADSLGETALHWASRAGWLSTVKILVEHGAFLDTQDKLGETALHKAVFKNRVDVVEFLIDAGAEKDIANLKGETARDFARDPEILRLFADAEEVGNVFNVCCASRRARVCVCVCVIVKLRCADEEDNSGDREDADSD
jgi:ankyrin repeat protein